MYGDFPEGDFYAKNPGAEAEAGTIAYIIEASKTKFDCFPRPHLLIRLYRIFDQRQH